MTDFKQLSLIDLVQSVSSRILLLPVHHHHQGQQLTEQFEHQRHYVQLISFSSRLFLYEVF
jgi:hypothetical protein